MKRRVLFMAVVASLTAFSPAKAQEFIPPYRALVMGDADLSGGDIRSIFETNLQACERACQADTGCEAFTFNTRNNSCFLKNGPDAPSSFIGAISAFKLQSDAKIISQAQAYRQELSFLPDDVLKTAYDLAGSIAFDHPNYGTAPQDLSARAQEASDAGDVVQAVALAGAAVAYRDTADEWYDYAIYAMRAANSVSDKKSYYEGRAFAALVNAYLRRDSAAQGHMILTQMAQAFEAREQGRNVLQALRAAQSLESRQATASWLEEASQKYGFRMSDQSVQSDLARPLVCMDFTENLAQTGVDYADYLKLPADNLSVEVSGDRRLCVSGLEHGAQYALTLRKGLPAQDGQTLLKDVPLSFYIRDRSPSVAFGGRGYVLPKGGEAALPVQSVNTQKLDLRLYKVTDRNILRAIQQDYFAAPIEVYSEENFARNLGKELWSGEAIVPQEVNRDMTTRLPLAEPLRDQKAGIYVLRASVAGSDPYENAAAWQWFVLSDLGVSSLSGVDGLHVFVRALSNAAGVEAAEVELLSRANEVLAKAATDTQGYARFDAALTKGKGAAAPAMLVVRQGEEDMVFLPLTDPEFDLSDRGVEGREPSGAVDVFVTTDRGAYRAGETVYATALARDSEAKAIEGLPLTAIVTRPDGVEYARQLVQDGGAGGHVFSLPIGATAPRGVWAVQIKADQDAPALARQTFLVEDLLPERLDFAVTLPEGPLSMQQTAVPVDLTATYLFGAPAGDLQVEGDLILTPSRSLKAWPNYVFGRQDESFSPIWQSLPRQTTDAEGRATFDALWPQLDITDRPVTASFVLRVAEGSGRPVERRIEKEVAPQGVMLGLKPEFDDVVPQGSQAQFQVVAVGPDLKAQALAVSWDLIRIETDYQWYQSYGNWSWEPVTSRTKIQSGKLTLSDGPQAITAPVDWGEYELRVSTEGGAYSSTRFWAGWYAPVDVSSTPDTLELSLDKPDYAIGDTAVLRLVPRAAGTALITVMSNRLVAMKTVEVREGENLIELEVDEGWGAGVYVAASVLRPLDVAAGRNPARALGLAHAAIDPADRALAVKIEAPAEASPRQTLEVAVKVDAPAGEVAYITLAAVDQGILNLTGFKDPDPKGYYFGQRKLGMGMRDLYGRLIDGLNGAQGELRSGGDAGAQARLQAPPPTEELVAYFTGPVAVMEDGYARASFDLPAFNGTVRLMAVAWTPSAIGQASAEVLVRDPVVVTASLPRFIAPGDRSEILLEIVHATGPSGEMGLRLAAEGLELGQSPASVTLADLGKASLTVPFTAQAAGLEQIDVLLTTPDGKELKKTLTLPVQVNDPEVVHVRRLDLASGQSIELGPDLFAGMIAGSGHGTAVMGPLARLNAPRLLAQLDRYPYGCTEQQTSVAMPLLYFKDLAQVLGLKGADDLDRRIQDTIKSVLANQGSEGGFGLWRAGSGDLWLDAYVTDFLSQARALGHEVPELALRNALSNLRNQTNQYNQFDPNENGGAGLAYALMVLAREGGAAIGDLRYFADIQGDDFGSPLAQAQLGAALASYGDQTRADMMFAKAGARLDALSQSAAAQYWRVDYGSDYRDNAGVLALAIEAGSKAIDQERLVTRLSNQGNHLSTQEASWALRAAYGLAGQSGEGGAQNVVSLKQDQTQSLTNNGPATTLTVTSFGVPEVAPDAGGQGYSITRSYYTPEGEAIDLSQGVAKGTRMVVVLDVTPFDDGSGGRLMVVDPLPAGFEIDNPNLISGGDTGQFSWLSTQTDVQHSEFRQDRFMTALDWTSRESFRLAYVVRAISAGDFRHPAAMVEDMYRPEYRGWSDAGRVVIAP